MGGRDDIAPALVEEAKVLVRDGFSYEPLLARKRIDLARLDLQGVPAESLQRQALTRETDVLQKTRESRLAAANIRYVEGRLAALEKDDDYLRELFESDLFRLNVKLRLLAAQRSLLESEVEELHARYEQRWEEVKLEVLQRQKIARHELTIAQLEVKLARVLDEIRWATNDLESRLEARRSNAAKALREFTKQKRQLEAQIHDARQGLEEEKARGING